MATSENLNIDLVYLQSEDRLRMSLRLGAQRTDWWLTRKLTTLWVSRWAEKMAEVGLPQFQMPGVNPMPRNLSQEHALSLEFDGPSSNPEIANPAQVVLLATEVSLSVSELECVFVLKAGKASSQLKLTRKEAHAFLEMLARKAKDAGWLKLPQWPEWLGAEDAPSNY